MAEDDMTPEELEAEARAVQMEQWTDIALAAMTGMLANPAFADGPQAAAVQAWHCVGPFYEGMQQFLNLQAAAERAHIAARNAPQPYVDPMEGLGV